MITTPRSVSLVLPTCLHLFINQCLLQSDTPTSSSLTAPEIDRTEKPGRKMMMRPAPAPLPVSNTEEGAVILPTNTNRPFIELTHKHEMTVDLEGGTTSSQHRDTLSLTPQAAVCWQAELGSVSLAGIAAVAKIKNTLPPSVVPSNCTLSASRNSTSSANWSQTLHQNKKEVKRQETCRPTLQVEANEHTISDSLLEYFSVSRWKDQNYMEITVKLKNTWKNFRIN